MFLRIVIPTGWRAGGGGVTAYFFVFSILLWLYHHGVGFSIPFLTTQYRSSNLFSLGSRLLLLYKSCLVLYTSSFSFSSFHVDRPAWTGSRLLLSVGVVIEFLCFYGWHVLLRQLMTIMTITLYISIHGSRLDVAGACTFQKILGALLRVWRSISIKPRIRVCNLSCTPRR